MIRCILNDGCSEKLKLAYSIGDVTAVQCFRRQLGWDSGLVVSIQMYSLVRFQG
jgi:hypothetical protein